MHKRYNKSVGKEISEIGFGGWQLGNTEFWGDMSFDEGVRLVREAIKTGVNFFDTAPGYSSGLSEKIIGEGITGYRDKVIINTKIGHNSDGSSDFSISNIEKSIDASLLRLKTSYLDSVILHNPDRNILEGNTNHFKELERLKSIGKIKAFGVSIDSIDELNIILNSIEIDVIEVMFNIIHQEVIDAFDKIQKRGILLIIKVPLDSGWLTGKYNDNSIFDGIRNRWNQDVKKTRYQIVKKIKEIVGNDDLVKFALGFILSFSAVTTVIPGVRNSKQLESNIGASDFILNDDTKKQLIALYNNHIKGVDTPW